jgi:hypothetical protein
MFEWYDRHGAAFHGAPSDEWFLRPRCLLAIDRLAAQVLNGEVITVGGKMNELEAKRKAFQNIGSDSRVAGLWEISKLVLEGTLPTASHGPPE